MVDRPKLKRARAAHDVEPRATILVVDDEELVRNVARISLERGGYKVLLANSGEDAVRVFSENQAQLSLIVLDMHMPGVNGVDVLRRVRAVDPNVRVLVTSGWSGIEVAHRFHGLDIAGVLEKPFSAGTLVERVRALCP